MDDDTKTKYALGIRAVYRDGDCEFITPDGEISTWFSLEEWISLRAYQDAERKKGVPILWDDIANDFMEDFNTDYQSPIGRMDGTFVLKAWTDLSSKAPHGQFTNFRWRAGYPKKGIGGIVKRIEDAQL